MIMQILKAKELFNDIKNIDNPEFECSKNIVLDFSDIKNIDLKAITTLLNLQKVAILNNKSLSISNVNPDVSKMLDVTGLNKTFANVATNPIKRQS
jgi:anti-anti-sigma factor